MKYLTIKEYELLKKEIVYSNMIQFNEFLVETDVKGNRIFQQPGLLITSVVGDEVSQVYIDPMIFDSLKSFLDKLSKLPITDNYEG